MVERRKARPEARNQHASKGRAGPAADLERDETAANDSGKGSSGDKGAGLLLEFYKVQISRSEHYENLRATLTGVVVTIAAAFIALATFDGSVAAEDAWYGSGLVVLGAFGAAANLLHGKRAVRHGRRAAAYRDALDAAVPSARLTEIRSTVPTQRTFLNSLWVWLPATIVASGGLLLWRALC